jgi:hypothetical protein
LYLFSVLNYCKNVDYLIFLELKHHLLVFLDVYPKRAFTMLAVAEPWMVHGLLGRIPQGRISLNQMRNQVLRLFRYLGLVEVYTLNVKLYYVSLGTLAYS